jgi:hypothetical protein
MSDAAATATAPLTPHGGADDGGVASCRRRSGRLRTIYARQAELKATEISFRCRAPPHAQVRVVALGAAAEDPSEANGGLRADGTIGVLSLTPYTVILQSSTFNPQS